MADARPRIDWRLPAIWVCENNQYAVKTPVADALPTDHISDLVAPAEMPSVRVDGNDVEAVHAVASEAVERARSGGGPTFIEAVTFRRTWHSFRYANLPEVRPAEQLAEWESRDPIARLASLLSTEAAELSAIAEAVETELDGAVEFAEASPFPDVADLADDVYAEVTR